ncbi:hypothetical protein WMY93_018636 [Mugilogobius chulae]|uniref:Uncharacterized protein n=1 Tax=Mugilogobius chulae TaxID=88201 RepID=A0AAW0NVG9_9GOBI
MGRPQQQLLRPSLLRPEELSMEAGQDYYYDQGYGSRRRLIPPMYDEYGEMLEEDYYYSPQSGRRKRIKLVVDRENETSSTGEESTTETQQPPLSNVNSHSNINGSIYLAQNGTIVRTRRMPSQTTSSRARRVAWLNTSKNSTNWVSLTRSPHRPSLAQTGH